MYKIGLGLWFLCIFVSVYASRPLLPQVDYVGSETVVIPKNTIPWAWDEATPPSNEWSAFVNPYNYQCYFETENKVYWGSPFGVLVYDFASQSSMVMNTCNSGLNSNYVCDINQDAEGNMWFLHTTHQIANNSGSGGISILHANGDWTYLNSQNSPLMSNVITAVEFDDAGKVWIGYQANGYSIGGLSSYDPVTGVWSHYHKTNSVLPSNTVMSITKVSDGSLWVCLSGDVNPVPYTGGGLLHISQDNWTVYNSQIADNPNISNRDWYIKNLVEDSMGNLWFGLSGSVDNALYKFDGNGFSRYTHNLSDTAQMYWDIAIGSDDAIYVNALFSKVIIFDGESWSVYPDSEQLLFDNLIQNIALDSRGVLWIAKYDSDMVQGSNNQIHQAYLNLSNPMKSMNHFWDLAARNDGTVYAATGWYVWGDIPRRHSLHEIQPEEWISYGYNDYHNYVVNDVGFTEAGNLMLAVGDSSEDAANLFDMFGGVAIKNGDSWLLHTCDTTGYPYLYSSCVDMDIYGNIWAGTNDVGLACFRDGTWHQINRDNTEGLHTNTITDIIALRDQPTLWIASVAGLYKVDITNIEAAVWTRFHPGNSILPTSLINKLHLDSSNNLWVASESGLIKKTGDSWQSYLNTLGSVAVNDVCTDEQGATWVATTEDGLYRLVDDVWQNWRVENSPLPTNHIANITSDYHGKVWLNPYGNGLYCMSYNNTSNDDEQTQPIADMQVQNYPNPFLSDTDISFSLPKSSDVEVAIFNMKGQLVRKLDKVHCTKGENIISWDGKDKNGKSCVSGIYLCKIASKGYFNTHKMTIIK